MLEDGSVKFIEIESTEPEKSLQNQFIHLLSVTDIFLFLHKCYEEVTGTVGKTKPDVAAGLTASLLL